MNHDKTCNYLITGFYHLPSYLLVDRFVCIYLYNYLNLMGSFIRKQINPSNPSISYQQSSSLREWRGVVSRANFKFLSIIDTYGIENESILWLACNVSKSSERYFVRQISKYTVYDHKKIGPTLNELAILTQNNCPYLIKVDFAFQDYESLYLVTEALESESLESFMHHHEFTEDETRYVVLALISVIEYVHNEGFAITELSPKEIHINKQTGCLKVIRISNPTTIDSFCSSNIVEDVCPYSAPEILFRDRVLAECDFYSLGLIAYELMTQSRAIPQLSQMEQKYSRNDILRENIEVEKSKVPEDWQPQVADFLIKLLIKNPSLRLGRYGSYEVKSHPWLKEFDMGGVRGVRVGKQQGEGGGKPYDDLLFAEIRNEQLKQKCIKNHFFQQLFQKYRFQRREGECETLKEEEEDNNEIMMEKTSIYFNESNVNLKKSVH